MKKLVFTFKRIDHPAQDLAVKFHGFLMEQLDSDYVDYLHQQQTNPYATKVIQGKEDTQWVVHLLTDDLEDKVFMTLLQIKEVSLNDLPKLSVEKVEIQELGADKLLEIFNSEDNQTYFSIIFETPTGFKSQSSYVIFPSMRLIFQSLMQKYGRLVENQPEIEEDTLDYLSEHSTVTNYRLETSYFRVHGQRIPAFRGRLTFKVQGAQTLKAYVKMLLTFGEYSGLGMKTSLGMGGIKLEERKD